MATPNYSKSEWASLSIQERIRAMNKVAGDDESLQPSMPSVEDEQGEDERSALPKRSSVVDIWRNREGSGGSAAKPRKKQPPARLPSPVSVPWPDEEENGSHPAPALPFQQNKIQQQPKPSWRSQLKSSAARQPVLEEKEADLTILPSTSTDHDEEVAAVASSHSKSIMDIFTKKTLTIPDSPMTVDEDTEADALSVATPQRSRVVDIWTKRTSGDTPKQRTVVNNPKRSSFAKSATPSPSVAVASLDKKKESPLASWNRRKSPPKLSSNNDHEEKDLVVVQDGDEEEVVPPPKASSVVNRYKLDQLRNVPPRPTDVGASQEESHENEPKQPSVVSHWGSQLRKAQRKSPSPVITESTVEDDEYTDESAVEEPKPSSVVNRWRPQASGESTQLRQAPIKASSTVFMPQPDEDSADASTEESKPSSVVNRWKPQATAERPQLRKAPVKLLSPVVMQHSETNVDGAQGSEAEAPKPGSVVNRWNPGAGGENPRLRKVPSPVLVMSHSSADGDAEPATEETKPPSIMDRWKPQANGESPQLRKDPAKGPSSNADKSKDSEPKRSSVMNRWNPQGMGSTPPLRKAPIKTPSAVVTEPSAESAEGDMEKVVEETPSRSGVASRWNPQGNTVVAEPSAENADGDRERVTNESPRPSVTKRWNPQGTLASPQLRKVINKVATPLGADHSATDVDEETADDGAKEPLNSRWKSQASETSPQVRKVPIKVPSPIVTEPEREDDGVVVQPETEEPTRFSVAKIRWNPQGMEQAGTSSSVPKEQAQKPKKPSVLDRYRPQEHEPTPRTYLRPAPAQESSPVVTQVLTDQSSDGIAPPGVGSQQQPKPKASVLDRYKPQAKDQDRMGFHTNDNKLNRSNVMNRYKPSVNAERTNEEIGCRSQTKESMTTGLLESAADDAKAAGIVEFSEERFIERTVSLPFDESPTTMLFASIDTSRSARSADVGIKAEVEKVYDSTDADGFPASSSEITKEEERPLANGEEHDPVDNEVSEEKESKESENNDATAEDGNKSIVPKVVGQSGQRSKALELFASRRKYHNVVYSSPVDSKPPLLETPVPKPAQLPENATGENTSQERKMKVVGKRSFHSGTSAFSASPKESEAPTSTSVPLSGQQRKRSKKKSMKEFLRNHRLIASPILNYSDTITTKSSASVGSLESSDKPSGRKRSDLSVNTVDESIDKREHESSGRKDVTMVPKAVAVKEKHSNRNAESTSQQDVPANGTKEVGAVAGKAEESSHQDEPGRIISNTKSQASENQQYDTPPLVANPSPRTRTLQERRRGRHKHGLASPATAKVISDSVSVKKGGEKPSAVQERAKAFIGPSDKKFQPAVSSSNRQGIANSDPAHQSSQVHVNSVPPTSDAGASDTLSFFSAASSAYSAAISAISVDGSLASPTSSLSNRASRALVRRRRNKLSKEDEKVAAQDLAQRVMSQTIKEQSTGAEDDDELSRDVGNTANEETFAEESLSGQSNSPRTTIPRGPGLSGRYNTSSRFMDSVHNLMKGAAPNTSFDSGTTEGSSQIRSVDSTSDSEGWMRGRMRKSATSLNRVPSDSTDGVSYQSSSVMAGASQKGEEEVVTDYFVTESASNIEALKAAYEAVSLHQLAMDLTDEVSVATNVDLKKIASNLNDGMSAASNSLRSGLSNLNNGSSSTSNKSPRKLKVPTKSLNEGRGVEEEVAIEVEYMEDSDEEDIELDSPISAQDRESDPRKASNSKEEETGLAPAGEPSQESSGDRRRAYV